LLCPCRQDLRGNHVYTPALKVADDRPAPERPQHRFTFRPSTNWQGGQQKTQPVSAAHTLIAAGPKMTDMRTPTAVEELADLRGELAHVTESYGHHRQLHVKPRLDDAGIHKLSELYAIN